VSAFSETATKLAANIASPLAAIREDLGVLVVLDSNAFNGDLRADRSRLRSVLDGAVAKGIFELYVPEVVLQELDKQFTVRSKKVVGEINQALGEREEQLLELGLSGPDEMVYDKTGAAEYRSTLEKRLKLAGARILPLPADLSVTVKWAVARRKPFKQQGDGFPDAAIWLSIIELAAQRPDQALVFVSDNTKDFAESKQDTRLAEMLCDDLVERGLARDQVRLVPGIDPFAKELAEASATATTRAEELAAAGAFEPGIERMLMWSHQDKEVLDLGVELDNDPQVVGWDLESLAIEDASQLPAEHLLIRARAEVELSLDLLIYRGDYYSADDDASLFRVTDPDFNESYVEASSSVTVVLDVEMTSDLDGSDVEVDLLGIALAPAEIVHRALRGRGRADLWEVLLPTLEKHGIDEYQPEERIGSRIEEIMILSLRGGGPLRLVELIESEGDQHVCQLAADLDADLQWTSFAPSPFDAEYFAGLALNESSGAPILQGYESPTPLSADFTAVWDDEHGWHNVEVNLLKLDDAETKRRSERMSAEEEAAIGDLEDIEGEG
jgi:PIN domain